MVNSANLNIKWNGFSGFGISLGWHRFGNFKIKIIDR